MSMKTLLSVTIFGCNQKIWSPGFNNCNSSKSRTASTLALVEKICKIRQAMNISVHIVGLKLAILWIILKVNMDGTNLVLNRGNSSLLHPAPWVRGTLSAHLAKIVQFKNWKQQQGAFTSASFSKYASSALSTKTVVLSYAGRPGT